MNFLFHIKDYKFYFKQSIYWNWFYMAWAVTEIYKKYIKDRNLSFCQWKIKCWTTRITYCNTIYYKHWDFFYFSKNVKIHLCLNFATFMSHNVMFNANFFSFLHLMCCMPIITPCLIHDWHFLRNNNKYGFLGHNMPLKLPLCYNSLCDNRLLFTSVGNSAPCY
jgi:hypothetical protein